jgi:hypothetical protein
LTFTAKGGTAADWVIEGNNDVGENLFDVSKIQEGTSINGGTVERNGTAITIHTSNQSSNTPDAKPSTLNDLTNGLLEIGKSYKLYITSTDTQRQYIYLHGANVGWNNRQLLEITQELLNSQVRWYAPSTSSTATISDMMICKASETIDHYIPYQQGVGERTENLVENIEQGSWNVSGFGKITAPTRCRVGNVIDVIGNTQYTFCAKSTNSSGVLVNLQYKNDAGASKGESGWTNIGTSGSTTVTTPSDATKITAIVAINPGNVKCAPSDFADVMFTKGSTAPATFIPYGYQIPIAVSQQGETDKNYDIYIGDSPLTEGETVSKTSTGVDIELFEGENTVSTTLYNKPTMEIETSYGVGVKDNNHYIIPFKVNTTIYNIQIGDSPLYDGEYLSYKEKKLYKYIDSVLTPIDPPSPFPEISTTEGVNKVIIETST